MSTICPHCASKQTRKRGIRKRIYDTVQIYQCKHCHLYFNEHIQKRTYPPAIIYTALQLYAQGHSLQATSAQVNARHRVTTSKSTICSWVHAYQHLTPLVNHRPEVLLQEKMVLSKRFTHENLKYIYLLHYYKLHKLVQPHYPKLFTFLIRFEQGCPDVFFTIGQRCSNPPTKPYIPHSTKKHNLACSMAAFAVQAARKPYQRHEKVEAFLLMQDTATIACEVPVWYWDKKLNDGITGHIDVLQVRNNIVYIMDYKPEAKKQHTAAHQLYHYAVALSLRTQIPLKKIRCAWFDEKEYYEFDPSKAKTKNRGM